MRFRTCVATAVLLATSATAAAITAIYPAKGGVHGGTRVTVSGRGFDIRGRSNDVYIGGPGGGIFCDPIPNECHDERIVCIADPALMLRGEHPLSVKSFGFVAACELSGGCTFTIDHDSTPRISTIHPEYIADPAEVTVSGSRFSQGDTTVGAFDFTMHIGDEERCTFGGGDAPRTASWSSFTCGLDAMPFPGEQKVKLQMGQHGDSENINSVAIIPTVQGVYPSNGSAAGGQRLTVYGTAFGRDPTHIKARVHGSPCQVVEVQGDYFVCITTAHEPTVTPKSRHVEGQALLEGWTSPGFDTVSDLVNDIRYLNPDRSANVSEIGNHNWFGQGAHTAVRFTALFAANETGNHTFEIAGDDVTELWIGEDETPVPRVMTAVTDADPTFARRVARCPAASALYTRFDEQRGYVHLEAGKKYWLQVLNVNGQGQAAVHMRASVNGKQLFTDRVPARFIALLEPWTPPVTVVALGIPAVVGRACARRGECNFNFLASKTPQLESVAPTAISGATSTITVSGAGFSTVARSNAVSIGGVACAVSACTATQLICSTDSSVPTGKHYVRVRVAGSGRASNSMFVVASPTVTNVTSTAADAVIVGTGFGVDAARVSVRFGSEACTVTSLTNERIKCVAPKNLQNGSVTATVEVRQDELAVAERTFVFEQAFIRPGTTTTAGFPSVRPMAGSVQGGTVLTITVPGWIMSVQSMLSVSVGSAGCRIVQNFHSRLMCVTKAVNAIGTHNVTVTYNGGTTVAGKFMFREEVTEAYPLLMGINDGNRVRIFTDALPHSESEVNVQMFGYPCELSGFAPGWIECIPDTRRPSANPVLARYQHTDADVLTNFDTSSTVSKGPNGFKIPAGGHLTTRRPFQRPISVKADMQATVPHGTVRMQALIEDPTSTQTGYSGFVNTEAGLGIQVNHWTTGRRSRGEVSTFTPGSFQQWRLDVLDQVIRFFIDDVLIAEHTDRSNSIGAVGFVGSSQDIVVRNLVVEDLSHLRMQVNVSGRKLFNRVHDQPHDRVGPEAVSLAGVSPSSVVAGTVLTAVGSGFPTSWLSYATQYVITTTATERYTKDSMSLCSAKEHTSATVGKCTVSPNIPAGSYFLRKRTYYGFSQTAIPITVNAAINSVVPSNIGTNGGILTIAGSGFNGVGLDTQIAVGGTACAVIDSGTTYVRCSVTGISGPRNAVVVTHKGIAVACTGCTVSVIASATPQVTRMSSVISDARQLVRIDGTNLGWGRIMVGGEECFITFAASTEAYCRMPEQGATGFNGEKSVVYHVDGRGFANNTGRVDFVRGIHSVWPTAGSAAGGAAVTIFGQGFSVPAGDTVESSNFALDNTTRGWKITPEVLVGFSNCDSRLPRMLGGFQKFDFRHRLRKTVSSIPAHAYLSVHISAVHIDGPSERDEALAIWVDGVRYTQALDRVMCHRKINDESSCGNPFDDCVYDLPFVVPHTAATADIEFGVEGFAGRSFGVLQTRVGAVMSIDYAATVGGIACPVSFMDTGRVMCTTPSVASAVHVVALAWSGSALACAGTCDFNTTSGAPVVTVLGLSPRRAVQGPLTMLDWTFTNNVTMRHAGNTISMRKSSATSNWQTGHAMSAQVFSKASGFVGIEFKTEHTSRFMAGLRSASRLVSRAFHDDIDFAFYNDERTAFIYESGSNKGGMGTQSSPIVPDTVRIEIDPATDRVSYLLNGRRYFGSDRKAQWPVAIRTVIYSGGGNITDLRPLFTASASTTATDVAFVLSGDNFYSRKWGQMPAVTIAGVACRVVAAQRKHVTCVMPLIGAPALGTAVDVTASNIHGTGLGARVVVTPVVSAVNASVGSAYGGQDLLIRGSGFSGSVVSVAVGPAVCSITASGHDWITCTTSAMDTGSHAIVVTVDGTVSACISNVDAVPFEDGESEGVARVCPALNVSTTSTATITTVSPSNIAVGSILTIGGRGFTPSTAADDMRPTVSFAAGGVCTLNGNVTDRQIVCTVLWTAGAATTVVVHFPNCGATNSIAVTTMLSVTSMESYRVSHHGGAKITFVGAGFGRAASAVSVVDGSGASLCSSLEVTSSTELVCTAAAGTFSQESEADLQLRVGSSTLNIGLIGGVTPRLTADAVHAPTVTAVSPAVAGAGDMITVTGSNLEGALAVAVGTAPCGIASVSVSSVVCRVGGSIPAAGAVVTVDTAPRGRSSSSITVMGALGIISLSNARAAGGSIMTVTGTAFGSSASDFRVRVGDHDAPVTAATNSSLTVAIPAAPVSFVGESLDVTVIRVGPVATASLSFVYIAGTTPVITSVSPSVASAAGGEELTITGTGFLASPSQNRVMVAGKSCPIAGGTATKIRCTLPALEAADANAAITVTANGLTSTTSVVKMVLGVTRVSVAGGSTPTHVSNEGGLTLTVTGTGFPVTNRHYAKVWVGGNVCEVIATNATALECDIPPAVREHQNTPVLLNAYPAKPEGRQSILVKVNGTVATIESAVYVGFVNSATPTVTAVTLAPFLKNGDVITVTGTGFAASANVVQLRRLVLNGNTSNCIVTSQSATQIVCIVVATTFGEHAVRVIVPGKGAARTVRSCPHGQFLMCDGTCLADADCSVPEWGIGGSCAMVASAALNDQFCHSNGGSDRVDVPMKLQNGKAFNLNCPMYSCEGGDCDTRLEIGGRGARISTCRADPNGFVATIKPVITGLSGDKSSSIYGGLRITVTGAGFSSSSVVGLSGAPCPVVSWTATELICETIATAASVGRELAVWTDRVAGECLTTCTGYSFEVSSTPVIASIAPLNANRADCRKPLTITGTGFSTTASNNIFAVGGIVGTVTSATATELIVTCPAAEAGDVSGSVRVVGKGLATHSIPAFRYRPAVFALTSSQTSLAGGRTITITGSGFKGVRTVTARNRCTFDVVSSNASAVVAVSKLCSETSGATLDVFNDDGSRSSCYAPNCAIVSNSALTPIITSATEDGNVVTIQGTFISTTESDMSVTIGSAPCTVVSFTGSQLTCEAAATHRAGTYPVILNVAGYGNAYQATVSTKAYALTVSAIAPLSGSLGGGQSITLTGTGFDANLTSVKIGGVACSVTSATHTSLVCMTAPSATAGAMDVFLNASSGFADIASTELTASMQYTYDSALTPTITAISPYAGSTAGGTILTVTGTNLATTMTLSIAGITCVQDAGQQSATTATTYHCTTGKHTTDENPLIVGATPTNGNAVVTATYQYIDLWSRWTTWGNTAPPVEGDSAVVSEGQTVVLDTTPPQLYLIIVMGHLKFEQTKDLTLEATYIMVNFGRFTIGTPEAPYTHKATIRLFGDRLTPEIPVHGSKVLAVRNGALDMHGVKRVPTWTTLSATAQPSSSTIQLLGPVDWQVGETIVVASTDYKVEHAEERTIAAITGGSTATVTVTLNEALEHMHFGERQCFGDSNAVCVDEVAEVILLDRNIVLEGDNQTKAIGFGGTAFLMPLGQDNDKHVRLSYVEFRDVGQQYIVGRYPVHFHVTHSINNSYVNGTSVHHSLNRAFSIHGTNNNTYVNNVVYDTGGHAFFIEDGSERWNVIDNNVVIFARTSTSNLNTDVTPACFWIVSASNKVTNNRAAGGQAYGFWVSPFHPHSTGPTFSTSICPASHPLWQMENNTAHSNAKYGLNIFRYWWPKKVECDFNSEDEQAVIHNHLSFKNKIHGVTMAHSEVGSIGSVKMNNLTSADNGLDHPDAAAFWVEHIKAANMTYGVQNSVLIALTNNEPYRRSLRRRAINLPLGDNFFSENITFVNYANENFGYEPQAWAERMSFCFPWGWEAVAKGLRWIDSPNRILYRFHHHGVINDEDGTLTGTPRSQIAPKVPLYDPAECPDASGFNTLIPAVVCNEHYKIRRWSVSTIDSVWKDQLWTIDGRTEAVPEIKHKYSVVAPINKEVSIDFNYMYNPTQWEWKMTPRFFQPWERMMFRTTYARPRHMINATFDGAEQQPATEALTLTGTESAYRNVNGSFEALVVHPTAHIQVTAVDCPEEGCAVAPAAPPAVQKACGSWETAASWTSGAVPADGADVNVTYQDSICLDKADGIYNFASLYIQGTVTLRDIMCPASGVVTIRVGRFIHLNGGVLRLGNSSNPLATCRVQIIFGAIDIANQGNHILLPWGARSLTVEAGELSMVANTPALLSSRLAAPAAAGATTLTLEHDASASWRAGDVVVISSTARGDMFSKSRELPERRTIASVAGTTVTLTAPLTNAHLGAAKQTLNGTQYSIGATVAVANRLIEISSQHDGAMPPFEQGWALNVGCHESNTAGCGLEGQGAGMSSLKTADLHLAGARFTDLGQGRAFHSGIEIDGLISSTDAATAAGSAIERCFFDGTWNNAIGIRHTTSGMLVRDNVFYYVRGDALRVIGSNNRIENNVVVGAQESLMGCTDFVYKFVGAGTEDCRPAAYRIARGNTVIGNRVAGAIAAGFVTDGDECGATNVWSMNEADSARDGVLVYDDPAEPKYNWPSPGYTCRWIRGVRSQNSQDHGVVAWYVKGDLVVSNMVLVDNMVGVMPLLMQAREDIGEHEASFTLRDSTVAGKWPVQQCREPFMKCRSTLLDSEPWCQCFHDYAPFMSNVGVMEAVFVFSPTGVRTKGEHKFMWMEADHYATLKGRANIDRVHFDQFDGSNSCGRKSVAFYQNPFSNDTFHQHVFSNIQWGSSVVNGGEFYARKMYGDIPGHQTVGQQSTYLDFDNIKFGAYWPDAPNKVWLTDADGTFSGTGNRAQILASETVSRDNVDFQSLPWDGSGFRDLTTFGAPRAGCTKNAGWDAFVCDSRFEMISLNIEHLGEDALTRRAAPVVLCKGNGMIGADGKPLCQGSVIDFASGPVMKGKVQRATLDRLTRFRFVAEQGGNYTLYFRGQPPAWMRLRVTNSEYLSLSAAAGVTVNVRYFGLNAEARVGVFTNGVRQTSRVSRAYPWDLTPAISWPAPTDPSGTHYHNKYVEQNMAVNVMSVSLREGDYVDLKQEPIVVVNMDVAMPLDEFFNNKDTFAAAMANVLGIESSRMKFVEIVPGSTRRRQSSSTSVGIEIEQSAGAAQSSRTAGSLHSSNDLQSVNSRLGSLGDSVGTFQVSNVQTTLHTVDVEVPSVNVAEGTDYVLLNVSMNSGVTFSADSVATSVAAFIVSSYGSAAAPHNATADTDVAVGNVFRDAANFTRFTLAFAYEENLAASNQALGTVAASVSTPSRFLPAGYNVVGYTIVSGSATTAAPTTATTNTAATTAAPGAPPSTTAATQAGIVTLPVTLPGTPDPTSATEDSTGLLGSSGATTFIVAVVVGLVLVIGVTVAVAVYLLVIRPSRRAAKTADVDAYNGETFDGSVSPPTASLAPKTEV